MLSTADTTTLSDRLAINIIDAERIEIGQCSDPFADCRVSIGSRAYDCIRTASA